MSQPWGYTHRHGRGLRGMLARWWLKRRTAQILKAAVKARRRPRD